MNENQVTDVRALLTLFAKSDWNEFHLRTGEIELFMARTEGIADPMARASGQAAAEVRAPHLATLVSLIEPGTILAAGEVAGTIELLGERIDLVSAVAGTVDRHLVEPGRLVEYDQALLTLTA